MNDIPQRPAVMGSASSGDVATPTQEAVAKRKVATAEGIDSLGRIITVKWLTPLERMRLAKLLGKDSGNEMLMGYAALAAAVTHIDGEDAGFGTYRELEALVSTLGDEGFECVGEILTKNFADKLKGIDKDAAKN